MSENKRFGVMLDCSRNAVMKPESLKEFIVTLKSMGYNMLMLYTEDTYEVEGEPRFGYLRGRYSAKELADIVDFAESVGVEMIPCIQTLAHLNEIFRWSDYQKVRDIDDILLIGEERTYDLIEKMIRSLRKCFKTNRIHIGMDEAHNIGKGKYYDMHGAKDRFEIISEHLYKVADICKKYDFEPMMWSDMFFRLGCGGQYYTDDPAVITPKIASLVPENVSMVYWDYYTTEKEKYDNMILAHKNFGKPVWFAGGAWVWSGFTPHNKESIMRTKLAMRSCREHEVENVFLTMWGDDGAECSRYSVLPTLFYASQIYHGNEDEESIKEKFYDLFHIGFDDYMKIDLPSRAEKRDFEAITNPDKFMLWSDPFLGYLDTVCSDNADTAKVYSGYARELHALENCEKYGYIFKSAACLCDVLAVKYTLGMKTRKAYDAKDRSGLLSLLPIYDETIKRLELFYDAFRTLWYAENKSNGFEVQDIRFGGLRARLIHCKARLEDYINGKLETLEELDEPLGEPLSQSSWEKRYQNCWRGESVLSII